MALACDDEPELRKPSLPDIVKMRRKMGLGVLRRDNMASEDAATTITEPLAPMPTLQDEENKPEEPAQQGEGEEKRASEPKPQAILENTSAGRAAATLARAVRPSTTTSTGLLSVPYTLLSPAARQRADSLPQRMDYPSLRRSPALFVPRARERSQSAAEPMRRLSDSGLTAEEAWGHLVQPYPVHPPAYAGLAPGKPKPVYPAADQGCEKLPKYSPTVYKIAVLARKMEWVSPYQMAIQRHWKSYVVELNSTQLNIYEYDDDPTDYRQLVGSTRSYIGNDIGGSNGANGSHSFLNLVKRIHRESSASATGSEPKPPTVLADIDLQLYKSQFTTGDDLHRLRKFAGRSLLSHSGMVRSYSLQYGRIGLAIDYKKKKYTLRLRLEAEQFLLQFPCAQAMIDWYAALSIGVSNALDLTRRPMPRYRTVPRRGRHRSVHPVQRTPLVGGGSHRHHHSIENIFRRTHGSSVAESMPSPGLFSRLKGRLGSSSSSREPLQGAVPPANDSTVVTAREAQEHAEMIARRSSYAEQESIQDTQSIVSAGSANSSMDSTLTNSFTTGDDAEATGPSDIGEIYTPRPPSGFPAEPASASASPSISSASHSAGDSPALDTSTPTTSIDSYSRRSKGEESAEAVVAAAAVAPVISMDSSLGQVDSIGLGFVTGVTEGDTDIVPVIIPPLSPVKAVASPELAPTEITLNHIEEYADEENESDDTDNEEEEDVHEEDDSPYTNFIEKVRTRVEEFGFPSRRKQLRDAIRCMAPLIGNEKWAGKYMVKDAVSDYRPTLTHVADKVVTRWEGLDGGPWLLNTDRRLQEYVVTAKGLAAKINRGFE